MTTSSFVQPFAHFVPSRFNIVIPLDFNFQVYVQFEFRCMWFADEILLLDSMIIPLICAYLKIGNYQAARANNSHQHLLRHNDFYYKTAISYQNDSHSNCKWHQILSFLKALVMLKTFPVYSRALYSMAVDKNDYRCFNRIKYKEICN